MNIKIIGYDSDSCNYIKQNPAKPQMTRLLRLWYRDKAICQLCMVHCKLINASRDHIIPKVHGGSSEISNEQLAHTWCNGIKGSDNVVHPYEYYIKHPLYDLRSEIKNKHKGRYRGIVYSEGSKYGIPTEALMDSKTQKS